MSANMFGLIVSGRLVQTDFVAVDVNKFLITIQNADDINHVVVFMTGLQPFPEGMAGSVYFSFPDPSSPPTWIYLGFISNEKPSAIFKITKLKQTSLANVGSTVGHGFGFQQPIEAHFAQIGISMEPIVTISQMMADPNANVSQQNNFDEFAIKTAENLFNYCTSFSNTLTNFINSPFTGQQFVPIHTIQQWYENFTRRLKIDPKFWKN
ncbi:protein OPI10 homolog [Oppia nitens]|uniref:protein OPI10 homolog n=1 Tax=Oppia nitens TaxID=1686743 RepID=UPI0023DB8E91|nr:protein OPI10 homolog [Oppia nitens]